MVKLSNQIAKRERLGTINPVIVDRLLLDLRLIEVTDQSYSTKKLKLGPRPLWIRKQTGLVARAPGVAFGCLRSWARAEKLVILQVASHSSGTYLLHTRTYIQHAP